MGEENENMGYDHEHRSSHDTLLNFPSAGMNANWDSIVSLSQSGNYGDFAIGNQGLVQYRNDSGFGSGSFPEMVGSFGMNEFGQTSNIGYHQNFGRSLVNGGILKREEQVSDSKKGKSPSGKGKKRESESISSQSQSKGEQIDEMSIEHDEKKQKIEHNSNTNLPSKQTGKQVKDNSKNDDSAKDYIHVRARRGQATNSHSLAERVRRERISERMRLLQDLVPGCNKITGKAVMLDEIINYVQSLQQQVEFLSMKLATVNPEVNIDIDSMLSKELLQSRGSNVAIPGFGPGVNSRQPYPPTMLQGPFPGISNTSQFHQMPQNMLDNEIHNLLQMGFDSYPAINNLGPSGRQKMDL